MGVFEMAPFAAGTVGVGQASAAVHEARPSSSVETRSPPANAGGPSPRHDAHLDGRRRRRSSSSRRTLPGVEALSLRPPATRG